MSLEQLSQAEIKVTSVGKKEQDLWLTPAAAYVITKQDIARSAASSIPELLRSVPGLQVAQINASYWAVTARGFNSEYASKLLVLVDGRTMYSEIYSGAHWDSIDLPLEDIERIEVIRGPGAAVWGTNAANGVINIISKPASETLGTLTSGSVSRIDDVATIRYGGSFRGQASYRAYARYVDRRPFDLASGMPAFDGADTWRGGGQVEWHESTKDTIRTSGDWYHGRLRTQLMPSVAPSVAPSLMEHEAIAGGFAMSRWEHKATTWDTALQGYYDLQTRTELGGQTRTITFDLDFQQHLAAGRRHDVVWGSELRVTADHFSGVPLLRSNDYKNYLVEGFAQDEWTLVPGRLKLTVGTKVQTGTLAGFQVLSSARLLFATSRTQTMWAGASQAAVAPSIQDKYSQFPLVLGITDGLPIDGTFVGNADLKPEMVTSYEAGYRRRLGESLTVDLASFFSNNLRLQSLGLVSALFQPAPSPHVQLDFETGNGYRARSCGVEAALVWTPVRTLQLRGNYAWMQARTTQVDAGSLSVLNGWDTPRNAWTGMASWRPGDGWSVDALTLSVGKRPINPLPSVGTGPVPASQFLEAYMRMDLVVRRKVGRGLELSAGGTNLQTPRHLEFDAGTGYVAPAYVPRSLFVMVKWTFPKD